MTFLLTLSNDRRSYSLTHSEFIPAAKMRPSGSKAATGRPGRCIRPCFSTSHIIKSSPDQEYYVYLTVLYTFICAVYTAVYSLSDSFVWVVFTVCKVVESFLLRWSFIQPVKKLTVCLIVLCEIYTESKEVDSLPDSFVTSDPKVWLSCPAIQREMNRW